MSNEDIKGILEKNVDEVIDRASLEEKLISGKKLRVKLGIDPTSPNIHIGRAVVLRKLRDFQKLGHTVIFIVGDFTGLIGDTSDKESERPMLTEKQVKANMKTYFKQAFKILDKNKTETHYNSEWLKKLGFKEIASIADLFGLHEFEAREVIARRLKEGRRVSLREVLYPLMQGYDSVAVKADVEIGGTDQRFNLLSGRVIQQRYGQQPQDILMTAFPLEGTDGRKMSSSWGNVININDEPNNIFGKVMSIRDDLIEKYYKLATDLTDDEIARNMKKGALGAKKELAFEITKLYHGEKKALVARKFFKETFQEKKLPSEIESINFEPKASISQIIVKSGACQSMSKARELVRQKAIELDGKIITDPAFKPNTTGILKIGKKKFIKIVLK
ncbi:tyrosine--tRNA ligase [Candidatus Giovannonibacteria bacterium RIFCSPLOWO2_02_FULL_43_11b]|uniref:Tyrosine--tRNA ligase n=1 Tax=Candidatus Giovannonibacteria bacterium RIFCSPHIGHO2_12_FULL_43_15 TaxID=1798341 RepID=A0A1F5WPR5_9BACT|nr:MAG: tyrosine--tRNA ligase [Candidatus Giovannonibacteria bacterium RIFCSPHIGHO2_01_FULL_43_100]OGF66792.1 MAG: tyrosine--tRNA ligase [Candidatus Giovannonibacteria bacterium RIFCSPHIGHO2_02_FULL_43_32]OGF77567.1 MAG: tyrosine--tRNA ligase [Candidatus Giovannonibacteria bacterium RIFCSPHIGHO2_12_FULL_43_15]OGF79025.1 MAG: tyrosine--tRNA ligase [Candidatus Giovannonibacteria bacterium RIFCSPLOWO2_01_FULL_43_60]OGF89976.1 MAG: tyrosine--tRNA ligase [Candidatus Giovannonibacteria bacterium RIFC